MCVFQGVLTMLAVFIDYQVRVVQSTAHKLSSLLNTDVCGSCLAKYLPENHPQSRGRLETTALNTGKTGRDVGRDKEGKSGSSSRASNAKSQPGKNQVFHFLILSCMFVHFLALSYIFLHIVILSCLNICVLCCMFLYIFSFSFTFLHFLTLSYTFWYFLTFFRHS